MQTSSISNSDAYTSAVLLYSEISEWCQKYGITEYDDMLERMQTEKPEWYETLQKKRSSSSFFRNYFLRMHRYDHITEARKQARSVARGTTSHDRRPVPCICTDNGMEFRSFHAAGKWAGVDGTLISDCCYGVRPSVKGLHFRLKENYKKQATE